MGMVSAWRSLHRLSEPWHDRRDLCTASEISAVLRTHCLPPSVCKICFKHVVFAFSAKPMQGSQLDVTGDVPAPGAGAVYGEG